MWPTPTKHNAQETGAPSQLQRDTPQLGDLVADCNGGQLNPTFVEYLMNYPKGWTDLDVSRPRRSGNYGETMDGLQNMRRAFEEIGYAPETLSATDEEKDWIKVRIDTGNPWHDEWPEVPRAITGVKDRANRLKCLGNSIVPRIAMMIFQQIERMEPGND
jgi:hypothetical protein